MAASSLPAAADDEVYWRDLVGCTVYAEQGELGEVVALLETGANDVLVVERGEQEMLIPFADPYVQEVDLERRKITVIWQQDWS